jgi:hypothetical protein
MGLHGEWAVREAIFRSSLPEIVSGQVDMSPAERRDMPQEVGVGELSD